MLSIGLFFSHMNLTCFCRKLLDHSETKFLQKKGRKDSRLMDLMKSIPGSEQATEGGVKEWVTQDRIGELLGDDEINALLNEKEKTKKSEDEGVGDNGKVKR